MTDPRVTAQCTFRRKTVVIAEIGENHLGNLELALRMVEEAQAAGADYAKFQSYRGEDFPPEHRERQWFEQVALSNEDHIRLLEHCQRSGIKFLSAPATVERAEFLIKTLGQREIKLASNRLKDATILRYLATQRLDRIFLSTGNGTIEQVQEAMTLLAPSGAEIIPLHCVSLYPTSHCEANLQSIPFMRHQLGCPVGYSDHTVGTLACEIAVALGACVIEEHFTLDKALSGTDQVISCDPADLSWLIRRIGQIEQVLGVVGKEPTLRERMTLDA